ncbi:MAG: uroporphyrinogen decarboxylase family protein [bacterium]
MNERERFRRLFRDEPVDRPPLFDDGVREEVAELWRLQGMPKGRTHLEIFGLTPHENVGPDLTFRSPSAGRVMLLSEREYRRAFDATPGRFPADWTRTVKRLEKRDHVACVWASRGFFQALGVANWRTLEQVLECLIEEPQKIRARMEIYGDFCARMLETALARVDPEFVYLSEPISDNNGPLISPSMFEELVIPAYERIVAAARAHGCREVLVNTYGNTALLFPAMIRAGVTSLWISEAAEVPELDYHNLRRQYGAGLGLVGGIPLSLLRSGAPGTIRERVQEIVRPLLRGGRYVPLASGRVREEIPWAVYRQYREALAREVSGVGF